MSNREQVFTTGCRSHCGGSCLLKVHVKDGLLTRIETDDGEEPQLRACLRCRAYRQRIYAPDRILHPLKRTGKRGEGKFERITWDDALDTVAAQYKRVSDRYGPESVLYLASGGDIAQLNNMDVAYRAFCMAGGCTRFWGNMSREGEVFAALATFGIDDVGNTHDDFVNSKLIILWAMNTADVIDGVGAMSAMIQAHEAGTKFIVVDPRFTSTAAVLADQWIPMKPGTDTAVMLAMAHVMITENLHDRRFLDKYTVGFNRFERYVLGNDGEAPRTPSWAAAISGVPAETIAQLAREYATTKPAALIASWGPGRSAMGEQYHRAAFILAAMTGNIGIPGGSAGGEPHKGIPAGLARPAKGMVGTNPLEASAAMRADAISKAEGTSGTGFKSSVRVHNSLIWDAVLKGTAGGYPGDYKMLYAVNTNYLNQYPNVNKGIRALESLEFVAVQEQFMTPNARYADIVLPTSTFFERNDVMFGAGPHVALVRKLIEPLGESRSLFEIGVGLAQKLGVSGYNDKTEEEWVKEMVRPVSPDYGSFEKAGVHKFHLDQPYVAFRAQIEDPANNPFPTASGKIEIFSEVIARLNDPMIPPIPRYIETWEGPNDPLARKYPLQLLTTHAKRRAHSQFDNVPWLRELVPQAVMIHVADAQARGIRDGDLVRVFNDRGEMVIPAQVTERIMPGVVDVPQGAWYSPDKRGVDRGGCANVLTRDEPSPGGSFPANTALVQVEKA